MLQAEFFIDKITNSIEDTKTGKSLSTIVHSATKQDISTVLKKNGWLFNWKKEYVIPGRLLFKLTIQSENIIQGLISLEPRKAEQFIEMHLIESAPHNLGSKKQYLGVPANLVAYACKMSFEMGFDGFVAFTAKTKLVDHYKESLKAVQFGSSSRMVITSEPARFLVNSYYKTQM